MDGGHVIYFPSSDGSKEKFAHTFHIRGNLVDPGPPGDSLVIDGPPRPKRRVIGKVPVERIDMKAISWDKSTTPAQVEEQATSLLEAWSIEDAYQFVDNLAEADFFAERKFGVYRHGGAVGWLTGFAEFPQVSRVLAKMVIEVVPEATFTSIWVSRNIQRMMHMDQNNDEDTYNYAIPIRVPQRGGELWVELRKGDKVCGPLREKVGDKGQRYYGHLLEQRLGECNVFPPRRRHEVEPWTGTRTMLIAYTPQCMGKLTYDMIQSLEDHGFQPPLSQLREFFVRNQTAVKMNAIDLEGVKVEEEPADESIGNLQEDWEMYLSVTHAWPDPTRSTPIFRPDLPAIYRDRPTWALKLRTQASGQSLGHCTIRPPARPPARQPSASPALAQQRRWIVGVLDVVAAFLKTPIGTSVTHPVVLIQPPRMLQTLNLAAPLELWALIRALYGLRQSPALWAEHRDYTIERAPKPQGLQMIKGKTVTSWWGVYDSQNTLVAVVLIYVDDFLLCGAEPVVGQLSTMMQSIWETSPLSVLTSSNPIRFLGMELSVRGREQGVYISQQGYVDEMLKSHGIVDKDKIPIGKDQAIYDVDTDPKPDEALINHAQTLTGELLWVAERSRPDISYSCCLLSTLSTRAPQRVVDIAYKVMRYLNKTNSYALKVKADDNTIRLYPDAAFAPSGTRSHSGFLAMWGNTPIVWRSARQATVALSTAESELNAILEGGIAVLGLESMLYDLGLHVDERMILSDSMSALTISSGTGSWRTRHLRIKASWLQEMLAAGTFIARHCPGVVQPADLLTKALPSQRLCDLLELWGVGEVVENEEKGNKVASNAQVPAARMLVAMLCCIMFIGAEGREGGEVREHSWTMTWWVFW